jgi:hypothetical protein
MAANAWDPRGWAIGNTTLGAYAYTGTAVTKGSRYSIYWRPGGGRIRSADLIAGREASGDPGNFENYGGQDVFAVRTINGQHAAAFCMAESPATSTAFGIYGWCPNAMMYREQVTIQPTIVARISTSDTIRTDDDAAALVEAWKGKFFWSMRGGLRQYKPANSSTWTSPAATQFGIVTVNVSVGDSLRYTLHKSTDAITKIRINTNNSRVTTDNAEADEEMRGVASAVAGVQSSADSALIPNELYLIGTCWAILEERVPENPGQSIFISDSEQEPLGGGNTMDYNFKVVKEGVVQFVGIGFLYPPESGTTVFPDEYDPDDDFADMESGTEGRYRVCSQAAQIFRLALASVGAVREYRACEIVIRSRVGINVNGAMGFRQIPKIKTANDRAGQNQAGSTAGGLLSVSRYNSAGTTVTTKTRRYSAFTVQYSANRGATWTDIPATFAIAGTGGEEVHSYLRVQFPYSARWEWRLTPVSSWLIRSSGLSEIFVLDANSGQEFYTSHSGIVLTGAGYSINPQQESSRQLSNLEARHDIGIDFADRQFYSMFDGYARFAESFCYSSVQSTVGTEPEHRIQQINYYGDLSSSPSYQSLALLGLNITASQEIGGLPSFSGFCNNGYQMPMLLQNDEKGSTNLFPDWLRELMTNPDLGALPPVPLAQIDRASFAEAAQWCVDRGYGYDKVEDQPLNILDWAAETAQSHLLKLVRLGGVYHLKKAVQFNTPLKIDGQFNNGNIEEGSFRLETIDYIARQPFAVQVKWREESTSAQLPLFARERVATVRMAGTPANAPVKQLDLSEWCTNYRQAIDAACYYIRFVTLHDHRIVFRTQPDVLAARLHSGGFFVLDIDVISYTSAQQGFIQVDGTVVSTRPWLLPLEDGYHQAIVWDMIGEPQETSIIVANGLASPVGVMFAIQSAAARSKTYEIKKVSIDPVGAVTIEAFHHPVDENGVSLLGANWTTYETDANWVIEL